MKIKRKSVDVPIYDEWNPWTIKSEKIPFKSIIKGIGDGEHKLGAEYKTMPLGQNKSYDLYIETLDQKWECKKLDNQYI